MNPNFKAVLFDAFGTLCRISAPHRPYRLLLERWPQGADAGYQAIMTRPDPPEVLAREAGLSEEAVAELIAGVRAEVDSIRLFPEVPATLETLRDRGIALAVVSNLATPYAQALRKLLPVEPDVWALSCEVGARKPQEALYNHVRECLSCTAGELLMVGDSFQNDYLVPVSLGMQALWLYRYENRTPLEIPRVCSVVGSVGEVLERVEKGLLCSRERL